MINLTPKAISAIQRIQAIDTDGIANIRISVLAKGCSGYSWKLGFDYEQPSDKDKVINIEGITVVVDPKSALYINGTILDFSDGLNGKGFSFSNPRTKGCGCGLSFRACETA